MDKNPLTYLAERQGCVVCGAKSQQFYMIEYNIFPRRLVRKRHREKEWIQICCRMCYEAASQVQVLAAGTVRSLARATERRRNYTDETCPVCGARKKNFLPRVKDSGSGSSR